MDCIEKPDPSFCYIQETLPVSRIYITSGQGMEKDILRDPKCNRKLIRRDEEGYYVFFTGKLHQEDFAVVNIVAPNTRATKFMKESVLWLKPHIYRRTVIVGDFNTQL